MAASAREAAYRKVKAAPGPRATPVARPLQSSGILVFLAVVFDLCANMDRIVSLTPPQMALCESYRDFVYCRLHGTALSARLPRQALMGGGAIASAKGRQPTTQVNCARPRDSAEPTTFS